MAFIESQVQMSQRSKYAYRWKVKDKMLALSILFHSRKAYMKVRIHHSLKLSNMNNSVESKIFS